MKKPRLKDAWTGCFAVLAALALAACPLAAVAGQADTAATPVRKEAPPPVTLLVERAEKMLLRGEYEEAAMTVAAGLAVEPGYIPLWLAKARAAMARGEHEEADEALSVCFMRDAGDAAANVLYFVNLMTRPGLTGAERTARFAGRVDVIGEERFLEVLGVFCRRRDFPEHIAAMLPGWRPASRTGALVRDALRLFTGGRIDEAAVLFASAGVEAPASLSRPLAEFFARFSSGNDAPLWSAERGRFSRTADGAVLATGPGQEAFAWIRTSGDWRDVVGEAAFADGAGAAGNLYLRYRSPESYVRFRNVGNKVLVQERVPGFGLSTIFSCGKEELAGNAIRFVLKEDRLSLWSGGRILVFPPLPVSPAIAEGRVAVSCENPAAHAGAARFSHLRLARLEDAWRTPSEGGDDVFRIAMRPENTGVVIPLDGAGRNDMATWLLAANRHGLRTMAALPAGSMDLDLLDSALGRLPGAVRRRIWNGVLLRPTAECDWLSVAEAIRRAEGKGLQTGLVLSPASAGFLPAERVVGVDWILMESVEGVSPFAASGSLRFAGNTLYPVPGVDGGYSSLLTSPVAPVEFSSR